MGRTENGDVADFAERELGLTPAPLAGTLGAERAAALGAAGEQAGALPAPAGTDGKCFRLIIEEALHLPLRSAAVVGVRNTADLDRRNARWAFSCTGGFRVGALMPPAIGFIFDRELRSRSEIEDITRQSHGAVSFLPSRMYENYLLVPEAIVSVLSARGTDAPIESVTEELARRRVDGRYR
jgi:hypothetical protein